MKKTLLPILLLLATVCNLNAQTLVAGDIAFVEYNAIGPGDRSSFSFVILRPGGVPGGTSINFTNIGWSNASNSLASSGEGTITWTTSTGLGQFTEVVITATGQVTVSATASTGTAIATGTFILSQAGDQVLAYQGSSSSPTFISGIHMNSEINGASNQPASTAANWDAIAASNGPTGWAMTSNRSAIPPGLTNGTNAIMAVLSPGVNGAEFDNGKIACASSTAPSLAAVRANLNNAANWELKNDASNPYAIPTGCTFGIAVLPVVFGTIEAAINDKALTVNWSTNEERNNDHFEIQASADGQTFKTIGTQKSLATEGNSDKTLHYSFSIALPQTNALMAVGATCIIATLLAFGRRRKNLAFTCILIAVLMVPVLSCNKGSEINNGDKSSFYLRIMQVDVDGAQKYSKVVKVTNE